MIQYKCCTDVAVEEVYSAFKVGFSDYMIQMELPLEGFVKRFLGPEGNQLEYSYIAFEEKEPVGLILSGMKLFDGVKTMRCGALCVSPEMRGKSVSQELFRLHKEAALQNGCKQLFLEVIAGNDRAVKFYSGLGYEKIYDLRYYTLTDISALDEESGQQADIRVLSYEEICQYIERYPMGHINWQNDLDYLAGLEGVAYYGAFEDTQLAGLMAAGANGKIFFVWTKPQLRNRGIARHLLQNWVKVTHPPKLTISTPSNAHLEGFLRHLRFTKDQISQYEMYLTL